MTGRYITEAYGLTETSPGVCANPLGTPWNGTIGLPFPSTDVSIRDDAFNELPVWTGDGDIDKCTGELCVHGPQVMKGYWNKPAETANVFQDGWLKTGDVGHLDANGYVTITDRKKDMIVVSGFKVFPNEIESVVASHPGVLECGAVGVPDDKTGEAVKVVIVKKDPALTKEAVFAALQDPAHRLQAAAPRGVPRQPCRRRRSGRSCAASCATRRSLAGAKRGFEPVAMRVPPPARLTSTFAAKGCSAPSPWRRPPTLRDAAACATARCRGCPF